jgi:N-acetylglutamate synthase-like GNAT family acetyltransferase
MIRLATPQDIPELQRLIGRSVRGLSTSFYSQRQIESAIRYVFGIDTQLIEDGTYYVCEREGVLAGCGGWSKRKTLYGGDQHKSTADPLLDPARDAGKIRAFFVHPDYARQGIGSQIIQTCEAAARDHGFTALELGATLPGVPLYQAMGYLAIERIDETLPDGEVLGIVKMRKDRI